MSHRILLALVYRGPHDPARVRCRSQRTWKTKATNADGRTRTSTDLTSEEQQKQNSQRGQKASRVFKKRCLIQTEIERKIEESPMFETIQTKAKRKSEQDKARVDLHLPDQEKPVCLQIFYTKNLGHKEHANTEPHGPGVPLDIAVFTDKVNTANMHICTQVNSYRCFQLLHLSHIWATQTQISIKTFSTHVTLQLMRLEKEHAPLAHMLHPSECFCKRHLLFFLQ